MSVEKAAQDVLEVRQKPLEGAIGLADRFPISPFGHGLGSLISIGSVLTGARHIDGVILTSPALLLLMSSLATCTLGLTAILLSRATMFSPSPSPVQGLPPHPDEDPHIFQEDYEPIKVQVPFIVAATATRVANRVWDMASTCDTLILILHGKDDGHTDPAGSKRLFETVGSCDKRLSQYEHDGHELLKDQRFFHG